MKKTKETYSEPANGLEELTSKIMRAVHSSNEEMLIGLLDEVDALRVGASSFRLDTLDDLICAALSGADDVVRDCMSYINSSHEEA
jgi:hypothetical protein